MSITLVHIVILCVVLCSIFSHEASPVDDPPVHHLQDDDPLRAVLQELCHFVLQRHLCLMLGHHLQVVP